MTHCSEIVPPPRSRPIVGRATDSRVLSTISTKNARHNAASGIHAAFMEGYVRVVVRDVAAGMLMSLSSRESNVVRLSNAVRYDRTVFEKAQHDACCDGMKL